MTDYSKELLLRTGFFWHSDSSALLWTYK